MRQLAETLLASAEPFSWGCRQRSGLGVSRRRDSPIDPSPLEAMPIAGPLPPPPCPWAPLSPDGRGSSTGPGGRGAVWAAQRVPDHQVPSPACLNPPRGWATAFTQYQWGMVIGSSRAMPGRVRGSSALIFQRGPGPRLASPPSPSTRPGVCMRTHPHPGWKVPHQPPLPPGLPEPSPKEARVTQPPVHCIVVLGAGAPSSSLCAGRRRGQRVRHPGHGPQ